MTLEKEQKLRDKIIEACPGRDITLCDVLRTIDKKKYLFGIMNNGEFIDIFSGGKWEFPLEWGKLKEFPFWDLTKNSLDEQSDETKEFLYKLICE